MVIGGWFGIATLGLLVVAVLGDGWSNGNFWGMLFVLVFFSVVDALVLHVLL